MTSGWSVEGLEASVGSFRLGPVDLALEPGHAVAVLGPSGAGKTTLLRALAGFVPARGGRILRDGEDVTHWPPEQRSLGYVPQGLGLFPHRTVAGNVGYAFEIADRPGAKERTRALLDRFGLTPLADRRANRLSGGEQQRVAIARALAADPGLIVWDEPWQGLDVLARHALSEVLETLRSVERVPIVLVTHDPALAFSIADRFLLLDGGRVRAHVDAPTLLDAPADAFSARFGGFENVFDLATLSGGAPGSLRAWLAERAGPGGIAFPRPRWEAAPPAAEGWAGSVRAVRPGPSGLSVELLADGLAISARVDAPKEGPLPRAGDPGRFTVEPSGLRALGGRGA